MRALAVPCGRRFLACGGLAVCIVLGLSQPRQAALIPLVAVRLEIEVFRDLRETLFVFSTYRSMKRSYVFHDALSARTRRLFGLRGDLVRVLIVQLQFVDEDLLH